LEVIKLEGGEKLNEKEEKNKIDIFGFSSVRPVSKIYIYKCKKCGKFKKIKV
jgi:hypothetical protein